MTKKKKIGIFSPYLDTLGGGERYILTVAECLQHDYEVEIFWRDEKIIKSAERRFNLSLSESKINSKVFDILSRKSNLLQKYLYTKKYQSIFFLSDGSIPILFSKNNFIHFQMPFIGIRGKSFINQLKLKLIKKIICNSQFTKKFIDKEFKIRSLVIYPPVSVGDFRPKKKENIIISVGRFDNFSQNKKQEFLIETFKKMSNNGFVNWRLILVGGISAKKGKDFYKYLKKEARGYKIDLIKDIEFKYLKLFYGKAKIYWHAAGFGEDSEKHPEKIEHFGISTVEAMASGCVPVVISSGGQKEIVKDGHNGFLWNTQKDLIDLTLYLSRNENLREKISKNSIESSREFSKVIFCRKIREIVK